MKMDYKDKYFSVLGDSISALFNSVPPEYAYYDPEKAPLTGVLLNRDIWWGMVIDALQGKLLVNNSFSGSTVCKCKDMEIDSYGSSNERTSALHKCEVMPDVIMINLGSNDCGKGVSVDVFEKSYKEMLIKLKDNYPRAEIWCLSLCDFTWRDRLDPSRVVGSKEISTYNKVIKECGAAFGCKYFDVMGKSKAHDYVTVDGVHPTREGMCAIAEQVLALFEK